MTSLVDSRDPGLQPERTAFAWRRTLLALVINDFLVMRAWAHALHAQNGAGVMHDADASHVVWLGVAAIAAAYATVMVAFCVWVRARQLRFSPEAAPAWVLRIITSSMTMMAVSIVLAVCNSR